MHKKQSLPPLQLLFERYIAGQIEDPLWNRFMQALDRNESTDRMALATFLVDAVQDQLTTNNRLDRKNVLFDVVTPNAALPQTNPRTSTRRLNRKNIDVDIVTPAPCMVS